MPDLAGFQPVEQAREAVPLRGGDIPGHCLRDHAAGSTLKPAALISCN